ncbi:hypothetical protein BC826DRAFT_1179207 [Russula brevipes]|nr:hypothetical protein BC826DRAFT_1179207 [Russula brevipes]
MSASAMIIAPAVIENFLTVIEELQPIIVVVPKFRSNIQFVIPTVLLGETMIKTKTILMSNERRLRRLRAGLLVCACLFARLRLERGKVMKHKTHLDCWPAFPIFLQYDRNYAPAAEVDEGRFFAALKHHDRIYEMSLTMSSWMLAKSTTWAEWSFPELQYLDLRSAFLNGPTSAPNQLRHVRLENISVHALPQFLVHSRNLVSLSLGANIFAGERFLSPEALVAALSATTRLRLLSLQDDSSIPHPEQGSAQPPQDLTGLPNLITLIFRGSVEYMEDLVSRIHAPLVKQLTVSASFSQQSIVGVPQLSEFISRTKELSSIPYRICICLSSRQLSIEHDFEGPPPQWKHEEEIFLGLEYRHVFCEMSQVIHICRQSSPLMSCLRRLDVSVHFELGPMSWLQLLGPFSAVEILGICDCPDLCQCGILEPLVQSTTEMVLEVLPALRILETCDCSESTGHFPEWLVAACERAGRPLEVCCSWKSEETVATQGHASHGWQMVGQ